MGSSAKLIVGALVVTTVISYLAYIGAASSWQYYLSVDETAAEAAQLEGRRIRVSGRVVENSLWIGEHRREAEFELAGAKHTLPVTCRCAMPDNLTENIDVVVEGKLRAGRIDGYKVITRCASKYEQRDVVATRGSMAAGSSRK